MGEQDISNRTSVINSRNNLTTLAMMKKFPKKDSFEITFNFEFNHFTGTYTEMEGKYDWIKEKEISSSSYASIGDYEEYDGPSGDFNLSPSMFTTEMRGIDTYGAMRSIQDLHSISTLYKDQNGKVSDRAKAATGEYFNKCLLNGLEDQWIKKLFGHPFELP
ncbi:hypothetical protein GH866_30000 [Bacillus thuringiensis]|nr:hypothetical protein [Bacillus thuringiensis]